MTDTGRTQRGTRERSPSINQTPPPGSRLAKYVEHFKGYSVEQVRSWSDPNLSEDLRRLAIQSALNDEPRLWLHPRPFVRYLVKSRFCGLGMPGGFEPPWLQALLDSETERTIAADKAGSETQTSQVIAALRPAKEPPRRGHPKAKTWPRVVTHAAYVDSLSSCPPGLSDKKRFTLIAERLGPGIDRFYVRREVHALYEVLRRADEQHQGLLTHAMRRTAELMRELDRANPPPPSRRPVLKMRSAGGY